MSKQSLRASFIKKRSALTTEELARQSGLIADRFGEWLTQYSINVLHTFLPIDNQKEINTWLVVDHIEAVLPTLRIAIPKVLEGTNELEHAYYRDKASLVLSKWNIPEPSNSAEPVNVKDIEMVLVPLLTFDKNGHRLGYGKGFYDRFLRRCNPDTIKVGLSIFPPIEEIPHIDEYDVSLDYCVTPSEIYTF
ncbi:MAG: 5-formyltetrahydrofolate cyclo-ligase [Bacteroidota bacterium]